MFTSGGRRQVFGLLNPPDIFRLLPSSTPRRSLLGVANQAKCISSSTGFGIVSRQQLHAWRHLQSQARCHPRKSPSFGHTKHQLRCQSTTEIPAASTIASTNLPPPRRSLIVRILATFGLFCVFTPIGFYMAAGGPMQQTLREMENIPSDEETLALVNPHPDDSAFLINQTILNHPLSKELFNDPKFTASRPHLKIPPSLRQNSFTAGTLVGPEMMPVPALVFATKDGTELVQILYVGQALCGHPGLVHGGMLATLMDEGLARCCFPGLPNKVGVTASLKIDYRTPCKAGQYIVLKAKTTKFEGRKAWVTGRIETLPVDGSEGQLITEGEALFIEPRNAGMLARQRKIVGSE